MKTYLYFLVLFILFLPRQSFAQCPDNFHDYTAVDIHGDTIDMSSFAGKKLLVVNTASFCGYTPQYTQLQSLYNAYGGSDFEIIGFPANNFGSQEPYGEDSIIQVCNSYNISFTMMSKISVKGSDMHPIYQWLTMQSRNCIQNAAVGWNFQKFMVNADGTWSGVVPSATSPLTSTIVNWINSGTSIDDQNTDPSNQIIIYQSDNNIKISATTEIKSMVNVSLYNIAGQLIETVYEGQLSNETSMPYTSANIKNGLYILEIKGEGILVRKKLMLL